VTKNRLKQVLAVGLYLLVVLLLSCLLLAPAGSMQVRRTATTWWLPYFALSSVLFLQAHVVSAHRQWNFTATGGAIATLGSTRLERLRQRSGMARFNRSREQLGSALDHDDDLVSPLQRLQWCNNHAVLLSNN
jgi:hypothetical protein